MASDRAKRELAAYVRQGQTETVTYTTRAGTARSISAIVDRSGRNELGQAVAPRFVVSVLNDGTDGIAAASLDTGGDRLAIAEHPGGAGVSRMIRSNADQDADWLTLEVS